jgi:L-ascorbate metabolism protein UlaG (beta-lactamase superfamily)
MAELPPDPASNTHPNESKLYYGIPSPLAHLHWRPYGPTALLEFGGVRLLTDPTFDPAGGEYPSGPATLRKLSAPALSPANVGFLDYVLLSHDHHFDNLDRTGRSLLSNAKAVLTTREGAGRLGGNSIGFKPWQSMDLPTGHGPGLRIVATPARHGPHGLDRGPVIGFVFFLVDAPDGEPDHGVYFSGDTVWFEGVAEVAQRLKPQVAILNLGAARVPEVGPFHLTMTASEAIEAARAFSSAAIVPLHFEGWAHFSEGRREIEGAFAAADLSRRLRWPERGRAIQIDL